MNRKILSIRRRTSRCSLSRKYSAIVSAAFPTRNRLPGGSFICPKIITMLGSRPASFMSLKFLTFAAPFADTAKNTHPIMMAHHVVDHLCQQDGLAHACSAKKSGFSSSFQRHQHVNGLDACLKDFGFG